MSSITVRGEAYLLNSVFKSKYLQTSSNLNDSNKFKTARNSVSGWMNRNDPIEGFLRDVQFSVFDVLSFDHKRERKSQLLKDAANLGLPIADVKVTYLVNLDKLSSTLKEYRKNFDFNMDGLVVEEDNLDNRKKIGNETNSPNPAFSRAFKPQTENSKQARVRDVIYKVSSTGFLKPTILIEPITTNGVTISKTTGFNAGFIRDNQIGPGSVLEIERAGDVIPHIKSVVEQTKAKFPDKKKFGAYDWNETNVDLVLGGTSDELKIQQLVQFFSATKIEYFSDGLIRRFFKAGYNTVPKILSLSSSDMVKNIPSFEAKSAKRTTDEFKKLQSPGITLPNLMYASTCFGRGLGEDKLTKIYNAFGDECITGWQDFSLREIEKSIDSIPGFTHEFADQYVRGLKPFIKFMNSLKGLVNIRKPVTKGKLKGQAIAFTGFRDQTLVDLIEQNGGKYSSSVSSNTTILLVKSKGMTSEKTKKAESKGVKVMDISAFKQKFSL